ncbi:hypothetical protein C1Y06_28715, partial [Pseudomonas sp. FW306-02-H06C]
MARELAPAGARSGPKTIRCGFAGGPSDRGVRLLRSRAGASSLATRNCRLSDSPRQVFHQHLTAASNSFPHSTSVRPAIWPSNWKVRGVMWRWRFSRWWCWAS